MTVRILDIYPELMNLYGERGNMLMLRKRLEESGAEVIYDTVSTDEKIDFSKYDIAYMGCGTESSSLKALECLRPYKKQLEEYIESDRILVLTGNAFEIFGESITDDNGSVDGLGIFTYNVQRKNKQRYHADAIYTCGQFDKKVIGYVNKCSHVSSVVAPMFNVELGLGNDNAVSTEGFNYKNVYATELIGPLFVRNPYLLQYIINTLYSQKGEELKMLPDMSVQIKAYDAALAELEAMKQEK